VRKHGLQSDFAERPREFWTCRWQPGHVEVNTQLSGNADSAQCTDRKSPQRSLFAVDEPSDCRKQYAYRYSAHQDANDAL